MALSFIYFWKWPKMSQKYARLSIFGIFGHLVGNFGQKWGLNGRYSCFSGFSKISHLVVNFWLNGQILAKMAERQEKMHVFLAVRPKCRKSAFWSYSKKNMHFFLPLGHFGQNLAFMRDSRFFVVSFKWGTILAKNGHFLAFFGGQNRDFPETFHFVESLT